MSTPTLQSDACQINDPNDLFPMAIESLRFPLDNSMQILFTGYYNGFNVEVRSTEESALLYHMGFFGKGAVSRSRPSLVQNEVSPQIMRKRQFVKRSYWHKKFGSVDESSEADLFIKESDELIAQIISDGEKQSKKDVIDLVSSDEDNSDDNNLTGVDSSRSFYDYKKDDIVVIVPNSESEEDDYFANIKPKCCLNKIKLQEKLMLTLQEAFFLTYGLGCLQIVNNDKKLLKIEQCWDLFIRTDREFITKYVVYHYFRSKGYVVKPGIKFGGDYLLYKEGPGITHADYIVIIKYNDDFDWITIIGQMRMATTTVKEILMVDVISPKGPIKSPEDLSGYSVREIILTRNIPVIINNDD